jgi:hypothetical protein
MDAPKKLKPLVIWNGGSSKVAVPVAVATIWPLTYYVPTMR